MAVTKKQTPNKRMWLVDPIYRRFTKQAFRNLTSGEFYEFFTTMLKNGEHQFQFSNRKLNIEVDETWVKIIEDTLPALMEITRNPRVIITQEELITNVIQAKRIDSQVVRHLCSHSYLVDALDENGDVQPSKVLNLLKEESWDTYENRFVYTLLVKTFDFVRKRYMDMQEAMNDEFGATLLIDSSAFSNLESMTVKTEMKIRQIDDLFDTQDKQKNIFARIKYIYEVLAKLMESRFAKEMRRYPKVRPPLVPTNAIKKNPYLRKCHKLWNFLLAYFEVGFTVEIIEQNPEINEKFEQDIFHNIMFTYIILKGYLEDNRDRALDRSVKSQRRLLRPRYIKEIVEEIVQDFNMTDVEVRKVLIEELTKEQLMREERSERYRLVEERRKAEEERQRQAELERLRKLKEKEKEAKRQARLKQQEQARREKEKAREEARRLKEKEKQEQLEKKLVEQFAAELSSQLTAVEKRREKAQLEAEKAAKKKVPKKSAAKKKPAKKTGNGETAKKPVAKKSAAKKAVDKKPAVKKATAPKSGKDQAAAELQAAEETAPISEEAGLPVVMEGPIAAGEPVVTEEPIVAAEPAATEKPAAIEVPAAEEPDAMKEAEGSDAAEETAADTNTADVPANDRGPGFVQRLSKLIRGRR